MNTLNHKQNQRGSIILWILIAIGLFAALGYAFNRTSSNSVSLLTDERSEAHANQIIAYGNDVRQAVKRLLLRGCDNTEISFENTTGTDPYPNPNAPDDRSCHLFDSAGGGLQYVSPDGASSGPNFIANLTVVGHGEDCADTPCSDLILSIRTSDVGLTEAQIRQGRVICDKINEALRLPIATTDLIIGDDTIGGFGTWRFLGTYNYTDTIDVVGINGNKSYCASVNPAQTIFAYHQILIAR